MRMRLLAVVSVLAVASAACGSKGPSAEADRDANKKNSVSAAVTLPTSAGPNCTPVPTAAGSVSWLPSDFPMPAGTYMAQEVAVSSSSSSKVAIFVTPISIRDYVKFALDAFPKAGFRMGRGDSESGEAEDSFVRGTTAGSFRIRQPYCDTSKSQLQITFLPSTGPK